MSTSPQRKGQRNLTQIERQSLHTWISEEYNYEECCAMLAAYQKQYCAHLTPRFPSRAYFTRIRAQLNKIADILTTRHNQDEFFDSFARIESLIPEDDTPTSEIFANLPAKTKAEIHKLVLEGAQICSDWFWDGYTLSGSDMKQMLSCRIRTDLLIQV
jgi:hypothetical protein